MKCKYVISWKGKCNKESDSEYCEEHTEKKCCICGEQATHGCDNTQFLVCGFPLCDSLVCDTIHEVLFHGWKLNDFLRWTGREHSEKEITYINEYVANKRKEWENKNK